MKSLVSSHSNHDLSVFLISHPSDSEMGISLWFDMLFPDGLWYWASVFTGHLYIICRNVSRSFAHFLIDWFVFSLLSYEFFITSWYKTLTRCKICKNFFRFCFFTLLKYNWLIILREFLCRAKWLRYTCVFSFAFFSAVACQRIQNTAPCAV